jgi:hypothetical protein
MVKIDSGIVVETPPSWQQFTDRGRCVFHTPQREEIIVSASRVTGTETESERLQAVERVFAGGLEAARRGVRRILGEGEFTVLASGVPEDVEDRVNPALDVHPDGLHRGDRGGRG